MRYLSKLNCSKISRNFGKFNKINNYNKLLFHSSSYNRFPLSDYDVFWLRQPRTFEFIPCSNHPPMNPTQSVKNTKLDYLYGRELPYREGVRPFGYDTFGKWWQTPAWIHRRVKSNIPCTLKTLEGNIIDFQLNREFATEKFDNNLRAKNTIYNLKLGLRDFWKFPDKKIIEDSIENINIFNKNTPELQLQNQINNTNNTPTQSDQNDHDDDTNTVSATDSLTIDDLLKEEETPLDYESIFKDNSLSSELSLTTKEMNNSIIPPTEEIFNNITVSNITHRLKYNKFNCLLRQIDRRYLFEDIESLYFEEYKLGTETTIVIPIRFWGLDQPFQADLHYGVTWTKPQEMEIPRYVQHCHEIEFLWTGTTNPKNTNIPDHISITVEQFCLPWKTEITLADVNLPENIKPLQPPNQIKILSLDWSHAFKESETDTEEIEMKKKIAELEREQQGKKKK